MNIKFSKIAVKYSNLQGSGFAPNSGSLTLEIPSEKKDKAVARGWAVREGKNGEILLDVKFSLADDKSPFFKLSLPGNEEPVEFSTVRETAKFLKSKHLKVICGDIMTREYHWNYGGNSGITLYVNSAFLYLSPFEDTFEEF